jgi:protein-disulfide isomerase
MANLKEIVNRLKEIKSKLTKGRLTFIVFTISISIAQCGYKAYDYKIKLDSKRVSKDYLSEDSDYFLGNKKAKTELYIVGDTTCTHCASKYACIEQLQQQDYFKNGKLKIIFKTVPSNLISFRAQQILLCAVKNSEGYYKILATIFENQKNIILNKQDEIKPVNEIVNTLDDYIVKTGIITQSEIDRCLTDNKIKNQVIENTQDVIKRFEISAVPVLYINGTKINVFSCEQIKNAVEENIKKIN